MNASTLASFFSRNKKNIFFFLCFIGFLFLSSDIAFAEGTTDNANNSATGFIDIIQGGLKIIASLLGVLTTMVALFLNPEWTSGTAFGLQKHLKEIWILVSNVVYFIFAMILIVIAFMNIIGKGDKWELKQSLPRFIVGVLIVPFSWFFVQFVVSVSAVLTVGVLTLPYDTFKDKDFFTDINSDFKICIHPVINLGSGDSNSGKSDGKTESYECKQEATIEEIFNNSESGIKNGVFGIISIYTYGVLGGDAMDEIIPKQIDSVEGGLKAIMDLGVKGIFDLVFVLVYCLLMFALFLALLVRGVWLWLYMMLSPAFGLLYFFEKTDEGIADGKFSLKEFIGLAMVPVYVSAALSFGLVFLFVAQQGITENTTKEGDGQETLELAGLKLTIKGFQGKSENSLTQGVQGALSTLIVEMFGIVILWIAVMAALKQSSITGAVIEPIDAFGKSVGSMVSKAPTYMPIPFTGGQNAASLQTIGSQVSGAFQNSATDKGSNFVKDNLPFINSGGINLTNESIKALDSLKNSGSKFDKAAVGRYRETMIANGESSTKLANDTNFVNLTKEMLLATGEQEAKQVADRLQVGNATELARAIGLLDEIAMKKTQTDIISSESSIKNTLSASQLDTAIQNGGSLKPAAGDTTVNIDVQPGTLSGKTESEVISTLKGQIGTGKIRTANLDAELADGGVTDAEMITNIKTALQGLINDSDSDGE